MNKKTNEFRYFPRILLHEVLNKIVKDEYKTDWEPNIIRLKSKRINSSLKHIDFAVPCFKLATELNHNAVEMAAKIEKHAEKYLNTKNNFLFFTGDNLEVESIDGYVNFCLTDDYFRLLAEATSKWFSSPKFIGPKTNNEFIITDASIEDHDYSAENNKALAYTYKLYSLLGDSPQVILFGEVENQLNGSDAKRAYIDKYRELGIDHCRVVVKSDETKRVNSFLDRAVIALKNDRIINDSDTSAIYYYDQLLSVAIRTIKGTPTDAAFIVYTLEQTLKNSNSEKVIVVFAPQSIHYFIHHWLDSSQPRDRFRVICYDPKVSRADVLELMNSSIDIREHFIEVSKALSNTRLNDYSEHARQNILSLIDAPVEFCGFVENRQIPLILDLINQTRLSVANLIA